MHLKRQQVPKKWPIPRKGTTFVVSPSSNKEEGIPLLIIVRDLLKIAQNRKEVKRAIHENQIFINGKKARDEKNTLFLFDVVTLFSKDKKSEKNYRVVLSEKGRFDVQEIKGEEKEGKISKIIGKKIQKGKKVQVNLSDGRNFLSDLKCNINDSVEIDFKNRKIGKCLPLKEKSPVIIFGGKHAGKKGIIQKIIPERKMVKITNQTDNINVLIKQIMVLK